MKEFGFIIEGEREGFQKRKVRMTSGRVGKVGNGKMGVGDVRGKSGRGSRSKIIFHTKPKKLSFGNVFFRCAFTCFFLSLQAEN